ncbi:MAG TPA: DUF6622 family protein [Caldimonas sp.]
MPDLPLSIVITEIIRHTPGYVWALLAALVVLGGLQLRDHRVPRARLALAPVGLGAFSLLGATMAFGAHGGVVGAWVLGMALVFAANRFLRWPRDVRADGSGGFALRGSPWPLVAMLGIFMLRYAVAVTLVFHREWATDTAFSLALALAYGALSGLFAARALRILRCAPTPRVYAAA